MNWLQRKWRDGSLGMKLSIAMLFIALPAVLGSAYYNLSGSLASVRQSATMNLEQLARQIATELATSIEGHRQLAAFIADHPSLGKLLAAPQDATALRDVKARFQAVMSSHPDTDIVLLLRENGDVAYATHPDMAGRNFSFRDYYKEAIQGRSYTTNIIVGAVGGIPGIYYSLPVKNPAGEILGVFVLKIKSSALGRIIENSTNQVKIIPFVIDHDGVVIYHPINRFRYKSLIPLSEEAQRNIANDKRFKLDRIESLNLFELGNAVIQAKAPGNLRYFSPMYQQPAIAGYAPLDNHRWTVVVTQPEFVFSAPLRKLFQDVWFSMGIAAVVIILLALAISKYFAKPIEHLAAAAKDVENGQYERIELKSEANDEIGQLTRAFKNMLVGIRDREKVKDVFGRMVSPEVREKLLEGSLSLGGETARVSVLFSDIREFSSISERMTAQEVVTMLNEYLSEMSIAVKNWGGYINNFIGDAIVVVFGAPMAQPDIETRAVCAALEMRTRLASLNRRRQAQGLEPLRSGIGISTGEVVAGQMGSLDRFLYTVIGDAVNVAARLETLTKDYPDYPILINDATREGLSDVDGIELGDLGELPVKGRLQAVRVWGVRG